MLRSAVKVKRPDGSARLDAFNVVYNTKFPNTESNVIQYQYSE